MFCGAESIDAERFPVACVNNAMNCLTNGFSPEETVGGVAGEKQAPELQCSPQQFGKHDLVRFPTEVSAQMQANVCTNTIKGIVHPKSPKIKSNYSCRSKPIRLSFMFGTKRKMFLNET